MARSVSELDGRNLITIIIRSLARSLASAGVPVSKEPSGLSRSDGKRPDGLTLIPWRAGRSLIWDVTVSCTTEDSYLEASSRETGAAAELAASI